MCIPYIILRSRALYNPIDSKVCIVATLVVAACNLQRASLQPLPRIPIYQREFHIEIPLDSAADGSTISCWWVATAEILRLVGFYAPQVRRTQVDRILA